MRMKHWSHEHGLKLVDASKFARTRKRRDKKADNECDLCHDVIGGPIYVCKRCRFVLDESCFGLSQNHQLLHNPLHSPHPLFLSERPVLAEKPHWFRNSCCDGCKSFISSKFVFLCKECDFKLDIQCALSKATPKAGDGDGDRQKKLTRIEHFSHPHTLYLVKFGWEVSRDRKLCANPIEGPSYQCRPCGIHLHWDCAFKTQFSVPLKHGCHPQHNLYYTTVRSGYAQRNNDREDKDTDHAGSYDSEEEDTDSSDDDDDPAHRGSNEGSDDEEDGQHTDEGDTDQGGSDDDPEDAEEPEEGSDSTDPQRTEDPNEGSEEDPDGGSGDNPEDAENSDQEECGDQDEEEEERNLVHLAPSQETDITFNSPVSDDHHKVEIHPSLVQFDEPDTKPRCKLQIEMTLGPCYVMHVEIFALMEAINVKDANSCST
ncbi:hypothetical protein Tsubulata_007830 [Turnera subulata]|uniref:DC1 domain-containing protein n=1 Tax=Turnera subulata TaxID=218843 RepID=A0A9Q0FB71_9ROSI|nr:hypothetical protein Tsubulata_007830 [Turnera subulata]